MRAKDFLPEKWSDKYKRSINCSNPKGFSQRAHCQGRNKSEDVEQDPGEPIPFPAGTTSVDVSDPYDWYKLGMVISDLDDANPAAFGKGGPSTVIAFGSEDEEHRLLPHLKRLGLKLQDIDRPSDTRKIVPAKALIDKLEEGRKKRRKTKSAVYGPGPYGWYGFYSGYSGDSGENSGGGDGGVGENLSESKSAPLYHFTTFSNLVRIMMSDTLIAPGGIIYFTRDYTRQFIPKEKDLFSQPFGLRINQELLARDYGRKLQAGGQDKGWNTQRRQDFMADPKNAQDIEKFRQTGKSPGMRYQGAELKDIVRGTIGQSQRWESEEHLTVKQLPNLSKYLTGIVIGEAPVGSAHSSKEIDPDALTEVADAIIGLFSGPKGMNQRNWFLDTASKLSAPIIYKRKEFDPEQVKKRIIQLYSQRKREREEEESKPRQNFMIITSPQGGGLATGGSDITAVLKKLSQDAKHRNTKIYGYAIGYGDNAEKKMFDQPMTAVELLRQNMKENFADGRNPQDKGDSKRHGVPTKASVGTLRKVAKQGGRKGQLAHWMANMKAGRAKNK